MGSLVLGCDVTYSREGLFDSQLSRSSPLRHLGAVGSLQFCTRLGDAAFDIGHVATSSVDSQEATASVGLCVYVGARCRCEGEEVEVGASEQHYLSTLLCFKLPLCTGERQCASTTQRQQLSTR